MFGLGKVFTKRSGGDSDGEISSVIGRVKAAVGWCEVGEVEAELSVVVDRAVCVAEWLMM